MQVKLCGVENCIQLLDKGSGLTTVGKGDTVQHALGDAVGAMLTTLLEKRLLSMHDLCREHIHFPHPDQETCPGVEINTCDLSKPVLPQRERTRGVESSVDLSSRSSLAACMDSHGDSYCKKMKSHCVESMFQTFMMANCYKTCTWVKNDQRFLVIVFFCFLATTARNLPSVPANIKAFVLEQDVIFDLRE